MIDELLKARIKHSKKLCLKLEESDADCVIDLIETLQQLLIQRVSGMFSEKHLIQAYNDGMEAEQQRFDNFDIENYR